MFKLFILASNVLISLLSWRGIRCLEKRLTSSQSLPRLAAEYADSYFMVEAVLIAAFLIALVQQNRDLIKPRHDRLNIALIIVQVHTLIGFAGLYLSVRGFCHMFGPHFNGMAL